MNVWGFLDRKVDVIAC